MVDFRWLLEPVVLKDPEPACQDQARSQPKPTLSAHPSARRNGPLSRETINYQLSTIDLSRHSPFRPCHASSQLSTINHQLVCSLSCPFRPCHDSQLSTINYQLIHACSPNVHRPCYPPANRPPTAS